MNVYKLACLPDGWHYGSTEFVNSEDCMGNSIHCCRVTATLWRSGKRTVCTMGVGRTADEALKMCQQNVEKLSNEP